MSNKSITADLTVKGRASYLILLQAINDLKAREPDAPPYFGAVGATVKDDIIRLAGFTDVADKPAAEELLIFHRNALKKAFREVFTLNLYTGVALDWVIHGNLLCEAAAEKEEIPADGGDLFLSHLQTILSLSGKDNKVALRILSQSVSHIPLRMALQKYKGYVSDAFKELGETLDAGMAESYKRFFNPTEFLSGVEWLGELRAPLDEIWNKDCAAMSLESTTEDFETINELRKKTTKLVDYLCILFDGVTAAYITLRHCPKEFADEARRLSDKQLDKAIEAELRRITFGQDAKITPDNDELRKITDMFYETGLEYFNIIDMEREPSDDLNGFLEAFLPCLDAPGIAANRRRFLRQHLMSHLPYPYSVQEYREYYLNTFASLDNANRWYMIAHTAMLKKTAEES